MRASLQELTLEEPILENLTPLTKGHTTLTSIQQKTQQYGDREKIKCFTKHAFIILENAYNINKMIK